MLVLGSEKGSKWDLESLSCGEAFLEFDHDRQHDWINSMVALRDLELASMLFNLCGVSVFSSKKNAVV